MKNDDHLYLSTGFDGFDVRKIDDHEYTVEISCYFLTKWKDDRLTLSDDILSHRNQYINHNRNTTSDNLMQEAEQTQPIGN